MVILSSAQKTMKRVKENEEMVEYFPNGKKKKDKFPETDLYEKEISGLPDGSK